jgi:hypothetical protein
MDNPPIMRTTLLALVLFTAHTLAAGQSSVAALSTGKIKADVMQPATSPRAAELSAKLQSAIRTDREAWASDVRKPQEEDRLAWNERLGLTRDEHAELQRELGQMQLAKASEAVIEFVRAADGRVMLSASLPELSGIVFDVDNDAVDTPFGRATQRTDVIGSDAQSGAGRWNGAQWTLDAPGDTPLTGTTVRIALGTLLEDGRGILIYEAKKLEPGQMPRRASHVLVFSSR